MDRLPRRRGRPLLLCALLLLSSPLCAGPAVRIAMAPAGAMPVERDRTLLVRRLRSLPKIDGDLSDDAWRGAAASARFKDCNTGRPAVPATRIMLGHDGKTLYIAAECFEPDVAKRPPPRHQPPQKDRPLWEDDAVEFLFDTNHDQRSYQAVVINVAGAATDFDTRDRGGLQWNSRVVAAAARQADRWTVELAIPVAALREAQNGIWGFNVLRLRRGDPLEIHAWNRASKDLSRARTFGHLSFEEDACYVKAASLGVLHQGRNRLRVAIVNRTAAELPLKAVLGLVRPPLKPRRFTFKVDLPAATGQWYAFDFGLVGDAPADILLALFEVRTGRYVTSFARRGLAVRPGVTLKTTAAPATPGEELTAEISLGVAFEAMAQSRVVATLRAVGGGETLARAEIRGLPSRRGTVMLDTAGLAPGRYELRATLVEPGRGSNSAKVSFELKPPPD